MRALPAIAAAVLCCCSPSIETGDDAAGRIRRVLDEQVEAWNADDLDGYMEGYWRSDSLTFHGGSRRIEGWEALRDMYASAYAGDRRGRLEFTEVIVSVPCDDTAWVTGRWSVDLPDTVRSGRFTLIFRRTGAGWRIVHDHSS